MTKYTTSLAFVERFPFEIWKIVVDPDSQQFAVELRHPDSTTPILYRLDFTGRIKLNHKEITPKEWTLDHIYGEQLILKKVGEQQPVKEGILILDRLGNERFCTYEHVLVAVEDNYLIMRHRNFQTGFETYLNLDTLEKEPAKTAQKNNVGHAPLVLPVPYYGNRPSYLDHVTKEEFIWLSRHEDHYLWSYHSKGNDGYSLNLCLADTSKILYEQCLLKDIPKMIPQPYFQIGNQLFLLSYNKQEIVSYLL